MGRAIDGNWVKFVGNLSESVAAKFREGKADFRELLNAIEDQPTLPQPSNEPLTLEELRGMGGQPYWHVGRQDDSKPPHWAILDPFYAKHIEDYKYGENWIAYRRPPEGEA